MQRASGAAAVLVACVLSSAASAQELSPEQVRAGVARAGGIKAFLASQANRVAAMSGQMIDADTQLMGAAALDSTVVHYIKMVNVERSGIDVGQARDAISKHNAAVVCTAPISKVLISELGAEYRYMVYSKSGEYLFQYSFDGPTCAKHLRR
jgi:hypothetical protein